MKRVKLTVAYDGTNYCGWQVQPNEITIEGVLNQHLTELLKEDIKVIGASRTDSGVHALGNVAVFDTDTKIPSEKLVYALNMRLPEDIVVQSSEEVAPDYHPRKCVSEKVYEYKILNTQFPIPTLRNNTYFYYNRLDIALMQEAGAYLVGEHDFKSFCSIKTATETTVRTIHSLDVTKHDNIITIRVAGNGFLYNMVRIIAGTLIKVGNGKIKPQEIPLILEKMDRNAAGPTAPAKGLTLIEINY